MMDLREKPIAKGRDAQRFIERAKKNEEKMKRKREFMLRKIEENNDK